MTESYEQVAFQMLDITAARDFAWPKALRPVGDNTWEKESFDDWWKRNKKQLNGIPEKLCEQWIYRYWDRAQFCFLPLESLIVEETQMNTDEILEQVFRVFGVEPSPEHDRRLFENRTLFDGKFHPTAQAFSDLGTWDYPIIVLRTPNGLKTFGAERKQTRLVLVEGHQRHRYLTALHYFGDAPPGPHQVYVLTSPTV